MKIEVGCVEENVKPVGSELFLREGDIDGNSDRRACGSEWSSLDGAIDEEIGNCDGITGGS